MFRVLLALVLISSLSWVACKKNDADVPNSDYVLKGLLYFDPTGSRCGEVGSSDDTRYINDSLVFGAYPNPLGSQLSAGFQSRRRDDSVITYRVVHAVYPDAPDSFVRITPGYYPDTYPVVVENSSLVGQEVISKTEAVSLYGDKRAKDIRVNMQDQPKGFYRLFVETNTGTKMRMGLYKY